MTNDDRFDEMFHEFAAGTATPDVDGLLGRMDRIDRRRATRRASVFAGSILTVALVVGVVANQSPSGPGLRVAEAGTGDDVTTTTIATPRTAPGPTVTYLQGGTVIYVDPATGDTIPAPTEPEPQPTPDPGGSPGVSTANTTPTTAKPADPEPIWWVDEYVEDWLSDGGRTSWKITGHGPAGAWITLDSDWDETRIDKRETKIAPDGSWHWTYHFGKLKPGVTTTIAITCDCAPGGEPAQVTITRPATDTP